MSEIKYQKLDTLLKYLPKSKIKAGNGQKVGKFPFYTSSAKLTKRIDVSNYKDESIILGSGGLASLHYCNEAFATSTDCFVLTKEDNNLDLKYVHYYLKSNMRLLENGFKGVGLKHISKKYVSNIKIPIQSLENQKKISIFLTKTEELIQKRQESIELLDDLIESTFLNMFGDPLLNPKGWETNTITEIVKKEKNSIKRGPFGGALKKEIFVESGYLVYEQFHALNNDFSMARYFINKEKFDELKGFEVKSGDIIISCSGVYLGKLAIVPPNAKQGIINQALLKVSLDEKKINNILFTHIFTNRNFKNKYFGSNRGAGVPNFPPMKDFKKFLFITPPINLQIKFIERIRRIEQIKTIYKKSLKELNQFFNSTAQKAFKGELNLSKIDIKQIQEKKALKMLDKEQLLELIKQGNFELKEYINAEQSYDSIRDMVIGTKDKKGLIDDGLVVQEFDEELKKMVLKAVQ